MASGVLADDFETQIRFSTSAIIVELLFTIMYVSIGLPKVRANLLRFKLAFGFDSAGMNPEEAEAGSPHAG